MGNLKGYGSSGRLSRVQENYTTVESIRTGQFGLSTLAHMYVQVIVADAAEALSTVSSIVATAHVARKGDVIQFTSGTLSGIEVKVESVTANTIVPSDDLSSVPGVGDTFNILRHKYPVCDAAGAISLGASALPVGASTSALQTTGNTSLASIDTKTPSLGQALAAASVPVVLTAAQLTTLTPLSTVAATQSGVWNITNVSGTVSLPTGASTSAKQDTGNTSLASIDGKLPSLGQALAAASVPVVLTAAQLSTLTPLATVAATQSGTWNITNVSGTVSLPTGASTSALQTTGNTSLSSIDGKLPALGQALAAASVPVVLTAAQLSTLTPTATSTSGKQDTGNTSLASIDGKITACNTGAVVLAAGTAVIGSVKTGGLAYADSVQKASGTVTSGAWVQLIASTAAAAQGLMLFDSSGYAWELGIGAAASEVRKLIVPPGGFSGFIPLAIAAGSRVSARALSTTCDYTAAELDLTLIG